MNKNTLKTLLSLLFLVVASGLALPQEAKADTLMYVGVNPHSSYTYLYDVNVDKSTYLPGEVITATVSFVSAMCSNGWSQTTYGQEVKATINGVTEAITSSDEDFGQKSFVAQNSSGYYTAVFTTTGSSYDHKNNDGSNFISPLYTDSTFTVRAVGSASVPYAVSPPGNPTASLTVNMSHSVTVNVGDIVNYRWNSANGTSWSSSYTATGCTNSGTNNAVGTPSPWTPSANGTTGDLTIDSTWAGCHAVITYNATNSGGAASDTVDVIVNPVLPSLSASPNPIDSGLSSTLTWSSTNMNATSCTAAGGFSTGGATSGSASTGPLTSTKSYQINCTGPSGSANSNPVTVQVLIPDVSIKATPDRVVKGGTTTISWNATNVNSCSIKKNGTLWKDNLPANGSRIVSDSSPDVIDTQTSYVFSCTNNASANAATAIVNVTSSFQGF